MTLFNRIEDVLARAEQIDASWAEVVAEVGESQCPPAKAWEADDDVRRDLAFTATGVLREVLALVAAGEDITAVLRPEAPDLIVMECPDGAVEYVIEYPSPYGSRYDVAVYLQPGEIFTVCPRCGHVNAGVTEVDRAERRNRGTFEFEPETHLVMRDAEQVYEPNPLAGLPVLAVSQTSTGGDFHTERFQCSACDGEVMLPEWIKVDWS